MWHQWLNLNFARISQCICTLSPKCKKCWLHSCVRFPPLTYTKLIKLITFLGTLQNGGSYFGEKNCWINCYFCFLCTQNTFAWLRKIEVEQQMSHGLLPKSLLRFLDLGTLQVRCCRWRVRELSDLIRNILICILKMNEGLTGLERHEDN